MFLILNCQHTKSLFIIIARNSLRVSIQTIGVNVLLQLMLYSQLNLYIISYTLNHLIVLLSFILIIKTYLIKIRFFLGRIYSFQVLLKISNKISSLIAACYISLQTGLFIALLYIYGIKILLTSFTKNAIAFKSSNKLVIAI